MCSVCRQDPCHSRCPNASDPEPLAKCKRCGEPMYAGARHYEGICEECLKDMSPSEWLEMFGERLKELEEDTWRI